MTTSQFAMKMESSQKKSNRKEVKIVTRYEIEQQTYEIIEKLANNYKVDTDFYGDCIPSDVQELENKIEFCKDEDDIEYCFEQIKDILEQYAIETSYEVNCVDCINNEVKEAFLKKDKTELFEAIKKAVPTGVRFQVEEMERNYDTWEVDKKMEQASYRYGR